MLAQRLKHLASQLSGQVRGLAELLATRRLPLPAAVAGKRIMLLGASVAEQWHLHRVFPQVETRTLYQFDKTALVEEAIGCRPDAIVVKECAAYFPSPAVSRELVASWVQRVGAAGIRPALATVVPVTREHNRRAPGRAEGLWAFNDWLREYSASEGVPLLDLEAALRCSAADRHLDDRLDSGDGLHLAFRAYRQYLDPLISPLLLRIFAEP